MAYRLIIGTRNTSSWSLRPYMALRHIGAKFSVEIIQLRRETTSQALQMRTPAGRVPVLEIAENGTVYSVWDSLSICESLAERHPDARLWPEDAKTRAIARSYAAEMHSSFADLRAQLPMDFARELPAPALSDATKAQIARILFAWSEALAQHSHAGGFLFGRFSVADCMYAPVVSRFLTYGIALPPVVRTYCENIAALPAMLDWARGAQEEIDTGLA
ncbi:MAG TPA: glutathione S-transferase [Rhizomicrobium sp.]|nr:glutathione S-transferase [Rhizomicrobium sp.]